MKRIAVMAGVAALVAGCGASSSGSFERMAGHVPPLKVEFASPAWKGETIPEGQQCRADGGNGATPPLMVKDIPKAADTVVVSFSDRDSKRLDNGGMGVIGFKVGEGASTILPAVSGGRADLSGVAFVIKNNRDTDTPGGYLPPCSGGAGHLYEAKVMAVDRNENGAGGMVLAERTVQLGTY